MAEVTIQDMMLCRENRAHLQEYLQQQFPGSPVLSFCMNIPGPVKTDAGIRAAFEVGKKEILSVLAERNWAIEKEYEIHEKTGDEWLAAIRADPGLLKDAMCRVEEQHRLGRIFDMDVIGPDGQKLSRPVYRTCLLCSRRAQDCARSRRHSASELFAKIKDLIQEELQNPPVQP